MLYSLTARCIGGRHQLDHFFAFLPAMKTAGFAYINLCFAEFQELLTADFDICGFKDRLDSYGLKVNFAHGPMKYPFLYHCPDLFVEHDKMMKALEISAALSVKSFVIHLGSVLDEKGYVLPERSFVENVKYLRPYIEYGMSHDIGIAIENGTNQPWDVPMDSGRSSEPKMQEVSPSFDELIAISDAFFREYGKRVCGICFDTGHAFLAGLDLQKEINKVGERLMVTHIHDNHGATDEHLPIGQGVIPWSEVCQGFANIRYNGELSLELYFPEEVMAVSKFSDVLFSAGEGLKRLGEKIGLSVAESQADYSDKE